MAAWLLLSVAPACGSSDDKREAPDRYMRPSGGEGGSVGESGSGDGGSAPANAGTAAVSGGEGGAAANGGEVTGGAAGLGGAGDELGGAGGSGGDSSVPFHGLYVGPDGDDLAAGTEVAPFETLAHAASVAQAGDTIVFLDGTTPVAGLSVPIPAGVNLMAQNAGAATISSQGNAGSLLTIQGETRIEGLAFSTQQTVASFTGVGATPGVLTIVDSLFTNCTVCLDLKGTAKATVTAPAATPLVNGGYGFATVIDTAELSVTGGVIQNSNGGAIFTLDGQAKLQVDQTSFSNGTGEVLILRSKASALLDAVTVATLATDLFQQTGESKLTIRNSDLSLKPAVNPKYQCFYLNMNGVGSLTLEDTAVHGCGTGFKGTFPATLTLDNVEVYALDFGMDLGAGSAGIGGKLHISGSDFHDFTYTALRAGSNGMLNEMVFRDTTFSNNPTSAWNMIILDGGNASTLDFGTLADPGGNTFLNANPAVSAMQIQMTGGYVSAVGNTWAASLQGADAAGHYSAPAGAGMKLEITADVAAGRNYVKPYAATTLLLAQNP